jgi:ubiquitin carboxyl-terminal hydrolase 25/28
VDELHNLFENLKTASTRSIKPTRELAELTIFSSAAEANFRRASISSPGPPNLASILNAPVYGPEGLPPSVPSRPSPTPASDDIEMIDHLGDKNQNDGDDSSETTLVDMDLLPPYNEIIKEPKRGKTIVSQNRGLDNADQEDAVMVNGENSSSGPENVPLTPEKPPPVPPRNKSGLVIQTNESKDKDTISDDELWKFGSQQDVTEVIGNVMFRLQCAIKPTSIDQASGEQIDNVRDTFFGANAVYNRKAQTLEKKVEPWANLIVFPAPSGPRDIYEALDVVFDEQIVEIDKAMTPQHTSIAKLPPILQIQIQRTAFDPVRQTAWKNRNPVTFPETIYLDRYMDSEDPNSALMRRRRETWKWKAELRVLEARQAVLKITEAELTVPDALLATQDYLSALQEEEIEGVEIDPALPEALGERMAEVAIEMEEISNQIATLKQSLTEQFTDMRECEYKLQTVFIHRGEAGGGHYWIYIYDFENDIWREYNDEYVTVVKDRRRIFEHQAGGGGTPYYLAYVRSADQQDLVDAVCREVKEVEMTDVVTTSWAGQMDEGIAMMDGTDDDDEKAESRHIEHAKPRPIRPKPAADATNGASWNATWDQSQQVSTSVDANGRQW